MTSDTKKKLLQEIDEKVKRRKELRAQIVNKNILDAFVLNFIENVEDANIIAADEFEWKYLANAAREALEQRIKSWDAYSTIEISWYETDEKRPQVNGVLIKWSAAYCQQQACEPELFIDATSLLLK
jgi:hypothetical protein